METSYKLLVVDDDEIILNAIVRYFTSVGIEVMGVLDGRTALNTLTRERTFDLLITDILLPVMDGLTLVKRVRETLPYIPIIILSAKDDVTELLGADDYLEKPFSLRVLEARVKALLQTRSADKTGHEVSPVIRGRLSIDPAKREVTVGARQINLTSKEFDLLLLFASNPGRVFTRRHVLEEAWDDSYEGYDRTVDSHINRLRAKIEDNPEDPRMLLTVWGIGYKFSNDE